jgi:DNA modification methylase
MSISDWLNRTHVGDCRWQMAGMAAEGVKVQTCVTSPPYFGLRDYGHVGQIGLETTPEEYIETMVDVFRAVRRILADDGTVWLNLGDSYVANRGNTEANPGHDNKAVHATLANRKHKIPGKEKDLLGMPWRVALALKDDGWYLRQDIIWHKPNPMPESVRDRCTKSHEYLFLLAKSERYYFDSDAILELSVEFSKTPNRPRVDPDSRKGITDLRVDGVSQCGVKETRNKRSVWTVPTTAFSGAHFATFPRALIEPCILAGAPAGGIVLDPFMGSGTTAQVATDLGRQFIGCELNPEYVKLHDMRRTTTGMAFV